MVRILKLEVTQTFHKTERAVKTLTYLTKGKEGERRERTTGKRGERKKGKGKEGERRIEKKGKRGKRTIGKRGEGKERKRG